MTVNGSQVSRSVAPRNTLADFLRQTLELTGTHTGCEMGVCGACLVVLDGRVVHSCLMFAVQASGSVIETVEGLTERAAIADLQEAFHQRNALQCGFCTPGMLMTAHSLLSQPGIPTRDEIRDALSGNYCRCTGYEAIVDAIENVARRRDAALTGADARGSQRMSALTSLDRPNSYIGRSVPRPNAKRLLAGRGRYVTDIVLPRMLHVAYVRSPYAHARIVSIDAQAAREMPGVRLVATGEDLARLCTPWVGTMEHFKGMKSPPQLPLPIDKVVWSGQAVVAVVADTRALAEDAAEAVSIEFEELPAVVDIDDAREPGSPVISPELGNNLCFHGKIDTGGVDDIFANAAHIVEEEFHFGRHTAVTLEPRAIVADYDASEPRLTVHHATQTPYQFQDIYSRHYGIPESCVRVIAPDIGGSFGMKLHMYHEDMAVVGLSIMLGRPVKFVADRIESFVSDIHARDHRVRARMAADADGTILAMDVEDVTAIGAFSAYPRTSVVEGNQVYRLDGRALHVQELPCRSAGGVSEQGADESVPGGRAPDRLRGHRTTGRHDRRESSA